jgi:hypothetical protein
MLNGGVHPGPPNVEHLDDGFQHRNTNYVFFDLTLRGVDIHIGDGGIGLQRADVGCLGAGVGLDLMDPRLGIQLFARRLREKCCRAGFHLLERVHHQTVGSRALGHSVEHLERARAQGHHPHSVVAVQLVDDGKRRRWTHRGMVLLVHDLSLQLRHREGGW